MHSMAKCSHWTPQKTAVANTCPRPTRCSTRGFSACWALKQGDVPDWTRGSSSRGALTLRSCSRFGLWIIPSWQVFNSWIVHAWSLKNKKLCRIRLIDCPREVFGNGCMDHPRMEPQKQGGFRDWVGVSGIGATVRINWESLLISWQDQKFRQTDFTPKKFVTFGNTKFALKKRKWKIQ